MLESDFKTIEMTRSKAVYNDTRYFRNLQLHGPTISDTLVPAILEFFLRDNVPRTLKVSNSKLTMDGVVELLTIEYRWAAFNGNFDLSALNLRNIRCIGLTFNNIEKPNSKKLEEDFRSPYVRIQQFEINNTRWYSRYNWKAIDAVIAFAPFVNEGDGGILSRVFSYVG